MTWAETGIRRSELVGLRTSDPDLEGGVLLVRPAACEVRSLPLPVETVEHLQGHLDEVRPAVSLRIGSSPSLGRATTATGTGDWTCGALASSFGVVGGVAVSTDRTRATVGA